MPLGFEQPAISQPHQQRIERPGFELRLLKQVIAMPPCLRARDQRFQNSTSLF